MSLSRQLMLLIGTLVLLLFAGTFVISVQSTRHYLEEQLASHAQDAATSLGLSATSHVAKGDQAMFTAMVNAMIHRGDYLDIRIEDLDGKVLVERRSQLKADVPDWFVRLFPLHPPQGEAVMMSGWRQVGRVRVTSNPGLAYRQLWTSTRDTLLWFLGAAAVALLAGMVLLRLLLRPLGKVEWQARAICNREFPVVEDKPFTLEFRRVVEAMNRLSIKVRQMLDNSERMAAKLREQAYTDALTGLANRRHFMALLQSRLDDPSCAGGLLLVQLNRFKEYNQQHGFPAGDRLLVATADMLRDETAGEEGVVLAHIAGADFAVLCEGMDGARLRDLAARIAGALEGLYCALELPSPDVGHVGGVVYHSQPAGEVLAEADLALRQAQQQGENAWVVQEAGQEQTVRAAGDWRALIEQALEKGFFQLQWQGVHATSDRRLLHRELFLRLVDVDGGGNAIPAGVFLPMAESLGLAPAIDRWVITEVAEHLAGALGDEPVAINMSSACLVESGFLDWLAGYLETHRELAGRLALEWPEYGAAAHARQLREWIERLAPLGVTFGLDHFGKGFSSFAAVRELKAHYLKLDGAFTRALEEDPEDTFFLQAVADIAHGLELTVIAESVESEAAWDCLAGLGIDGGRGYHLGRPTDVRA